MSQDQTGDNASAASGNTQNGKPAIDEQLTFSTVMSKSQIAKIASFNRRYLYGLNFCIALTFALFLLFGWNFYQRTHKIPPDFFSVDHHYQDSTQIPPWDNFVIDGNSIVPPQADELNKMRALLYPNMTPNVLLKWVVNAATASLTFNFYNYQQVLNESKQYFTEAGYQNFLSALERSGVVESVRQKQLAVYAVATDIPVVLKEGNILGGKYAWQVQLSMLMSYEAETVNKVEVIVTMLVSEVPTDVSVKGLGISSFVMQGK